MPIDPNPSNLCVSCLRANVDITEGIPKQVNIYLCRFCERYLNPPNQWVACALESRELMALCLKRIKNLSKVVVGIFFHPENDYSVWVLLLSCSQLYS